MKNIYNAKKWNKKEISLITVFVASVVLAMIFCVIYKSESLLQTEVLSQSSLSLVKIQGSNKGSLFLCVLRERVWMIPILFLFSTTYLAMPAVWGTVILYGISFGTVLSLTILRYGMGGVFFLLLAGFPQYLIYIPVLMIALRVTGNIRKPDRNFYLQFIVLESLVIVGCFLESFINSLFLHRVIYFLIGV